MVGHRSREGRIGRQLAQAMPLSVAELSGEDGAFGSLVCHPVKGTASGPWAAELALGIACQFSGVPSRILHIRLPWRS